MKRTSPGFLRNARTTEPGAAACAQLPRRDFLRTLTGGGIAAAALLAGGAGAMARAQSTPAAPPPNIVVILFDDLGFGDLHCYGSSIPTPNIDLMAHEGVRFEHFYSASAICSPSRAALLTGRYPARVGVPDVVSPSSTAGLSLTDTTIAEMLKPVGYNTMCVGKWHLGTAPAYLPTSRGFDHYWGIPYSNDQMPSILMQDTTIIESPVELDTLTQRYTQQATNFIQQSKKSPFFLYMPHTFPHIPLAASTAFKGSTRMGLYADVIAELDWSVGQVLQSLKDNGVDNNTLTILTSDNGPWYLGSPGKLRGRKGWTYDGGVREPFIARFPGRIPDGLSQREGTAQPAEAAPAPKAHAAAIEHGPSQTAARVSTSMASMMDILPTIASLANAKLPGKPLDGVNIWPVLSGARNAVDHDLFLYFDSWNIQCARLGAWKLHVARYNDFPWNPDPPGGRINLPLAQPELYNLETDPDESYDVAADHPDTVAGIQARILRALPTFPSAVQYAWTTTMNLKSTNPDGGLPVQIP